MEPCSRIYYSNVS